jgi:cell division protein FtsL
MASATAAAHVETAVAVRRPRPRPQPRARVRGGVLWIVLVAGLLTGVVALNVAVLRLNVRADKLSRERASLIAQNQALSSEVSSAAIMGRIQDRARKQLGLVPAAPDKTDFVNLGG